MSVEIAIEQYHSSKKIIGKINALDYEEILENINDPNSNRGLIERFIIKISYNLV